MSGKKIRVAASAEINEGKLFASQAEGQKLLLSRVKGKIYAVVDRCPHMGLSLARGKVEAGVVTCPWHNSRFDLCTGKNMDWASAVLGVPMPKWTHKVLAMGKAPAPLRTATAEEVNGEVFVYV